MRIPGVRFFRRLGALALVLAVPSIATAQSVHDVTDDASLRLAISAANPGETIRFLNNITLAGDLPSIGADITINGNGFTLDGASTYRGLVVALFGGANPVAATVTIENLTIANTVARGGDGGTGTAGGGGGGAGFGGAIYIADQANVTLRNINITSSAAVGGNGGTTVGPAGGGGGGGLGGAGGSGGGGGGGAGQSAVGGTGVAGGFGILVGAGPGGDAGGAFGGGGGGTSAFGGGGGGGGAAGGTGGSGTGGSGGYGGGGGGGLAFGGAGAGGFGGGGGGSDLGGGLGGFGGGGGGTSGTTTLGGAAGFGAGAGASGLAGGGGGGGAGMGGAIFIQNGATVTFEGTLTINGSAVTGGTGGGGNGFGFGQGLFLQDGGTLTFNQAAGVTATISDTIADERAFRPPLYDVGSWDLVKTGAGTLVLSGANLYSGTTTIDSGTLSVASDSNLGRSWPLGGDVRIGDGATLDITGNSSFGRGLYLLGTATVRVGGGISAAWNNFVTDNDGPAILSVNGGGTLALGNTTNSFSGGLQVIGNSTVEFANDGALGLAGSGIQLGDAASGGTLRLTGGTVTSTRNILFGGPGRGTFDVAAGSELTLAGVVSGSASLVKSGAGTLILSGANTYLGGTTVAAGTLRAGAVNVFGAGRMDVQTGATLDLNNFAQTFGSLTGGGAITLGTGILNAGADNSSTTFGGSISGAGSLVKVGTGTLTLTGANTYSGGTTVSQGVLVGTTASIQGNILNSGVVEFSQTATGTYGGAISGAGALVKSGGGTLTLTGANTYGGGTTISGGVLVGNTTSLQGNVLNNAAIVFNQASAGTFAGTVAGVGTFTKTGAGMLTLVASQTYTGATAIDAGVLRAGTANVFSGTSGVTVAAGATFDLNGFNQSVGTLSGDGSIALGSATLTTGGSGNTTLGGSISGTGSLVKSGAGTLTLLGANTYSGGTTISGGSLVGNTTSLQGNILNNANVTFDQALAGTFAGSISGSGSLTKIGAGTLALTGVNTYTGGTTINAGTIVGNTSSLTGTITNNGLVVFNQTSAGTLTGSLGGSGAVQKTGAGTLTLGAAGAFTGTTTITEGVLRAGAGNVFTASGPIAIGSGATLDLNGFSHTLNALSGTGTIALGGATLTTGTDGGSRTIGSAITGPGSLVKAGGGTLALTAANTYTGGTTVSGGILLGNTTSLQGNILNDSRVVFDQTFNGTYAGVMSGTGILEKAGGGTLTLTGANTYSGGTVITGGSIVATATSLRGAIVNNSGLTFGGASDGALSGTLGGIGNFTKTGTGTLSLIGNHPFSGLTTVSQGTLSLNGAMGGTVVVQPGAFFQATGALFGHLTLIGGTLTLPTPAFGALMAATADGRGAASSGDRLTTPPLFTIEGNFVAGEGSFLNLPLGPGPNPSMFVTGVAALNGTTLDARPIELGTQRTVSFLALTAAGGLTVANSGVVTENPLLIPSLRSDGHTLAVSIINLGVPVEFAANPELKGVGAAIDRLKGDLTGDRGFVVRELLSLGDDELQGALRQIAGEIHATRTLVDIRSSEIFTDLVRNMMSDRDHEAAEDELRASGPGWAGHSVRFFGQFGREHVSYDAVNGTAGGAADISDGAGGFEVKLSNSWLVGGGGGLGFGSLALDGLTAGSDFNAPRAFGVVGYKPKGFAIRGGGSLARSKSKTKRQIAFLARLPDALGGAPLTGGVDREALTEEITVQNDQWGEFADHYSFGTYRLDYFVGIRRAHFSRDGFTEIGADALSLESDGASLKLTDADVKVHWWRRRGGIRPYAEVFVRRTSGFELSLPVEFAEEEDSDFDSKGLPMGQNAFAARIGTTFVRRIGSLTLEYRFRKTSGQTGQAFDMRFRF